MTRLPSMNAIRALEAAVRLNSFTAAANELNITQGAVSRHIRAIEVMLGVKLFTSAGRGLVPTVRANAYVLELRAALDRIRIATEQIAEPDKSHLLRVNSNQTFAARWLIPRLPDFEKKNPGIEVRVSISVLPVEQLADPFEIVFRRYNMKFPGYECRVILQDHCLPVCSPELTERLPLRTFEDISKHTLLCHYSFAGMWDRWLSMAGIAKLDQPRRLYFDHLYMSLQAANDGLGLALVPINLVSRELHLGRLIAPFGEPVVPCEPVEVLYPASKNASKNTKRFVKWLFEQNGGNVHVGDAQLTNRLTSPLVVPASRS